MTGLALREQERAAEALGAYDRRPMFAVDRAGRRALGRRRASSRSTRSSGPPASARRSPTWRPLRLRSPLGGIQLDGTTAVADPRVQLVGYGPSASTIGANRAGRGRGSRRLALAQTLPATLASRRDQPLQLARPAGRGLDQRRRCARSRTPARTRSSGTPCSSAQASR